MFAVSFFLLFISYIEIMVITVK